MEKQDERDKITYFFEALKEFLYHVSTNQEDKAKVVLGDGMKKVTYVEKEWSCVRIYCDGMYPGGIINVFYDGVKVFCSHHWGQIIGNADVESINDCLSAALGAPDKDTPWCGPERFNYGGNEYVSIRNSLIGSPEKILVDEIIVDDKSHMAYKGGYVGGFENLDQIPDLRP